MTNRIGIDTSTPPSTLGVVENIANRNSILGLNSPYTEYRNNYMDTRLGKTWALASGSNNGVWHGFGEDLVFERIWVVPSEFNARFITTDMSQTFNIWNAFQRVAKYFTNVSVLAPDGTSIVNPTLPYKLQPTADLNIIINVFKQGPSVQSTIYTITIGGVVFNIPVRGLRILALSRLPNFIADPELTYQYNTSIYQSERVLEQRRSVRDIPVRELKCKFMVQGSVGQQFLNRIQYAHDKIMGIPVVDEALIPTSITTGAKTINLSNITTDKWNFVNLCSFIGIYQPDINQVEIHEVDTYTSNSITTINNIAYSYDVSKTTIFPVFFGVISSVSVNDETDDLISADVEFSETKVSV